MNIKKQSGLFLPPENILEDIQMFVIANLMNQIRIRFQDKKIINFCSSIDNSIQNNKTINNLKTTFIYNQNDIKNWKYLQSKNINDFELEINIEINFEENNSYLQAFGTWFYMFIGKNISNIKNAQDIKNIINEILQSIKHETIHISQYIIRIALDIDDIGGLPKIKLQNKITNLNDQNIEHSLREVEFYPGLNDAVNLFIQNINKQKDKINYFKTFIGIPSNESDAIISHFLQQLYLNNHQKWKKAVKEFYKAVKDKIEQ